MNNYSSFWKKTKNWFNRWRSIQTNISSISRHADKNKIKMKYRWRRRWTATLIASIFIYKTNVFLNSRMNDWPTARQICSSWIIINGIVTFNWKLSIWKSSVLCWPRKIDYKLDETKQNETKKTYLIIFGYSLSLPWESRHLRYITDASTLAGEYVFGSFSNEITDSKIVRTFCVGFHLSHGNSPLCGSSIGGCNIEIHKSPFYLDVKEKNANWQIN